MGTLQCRSLVLFYILSTFSCLVMALVNLDCQPRPAVVDTRNGPKFTYYPYFVSLHRCSGTKDMTSPSLVKCIPHTTESLKIDAHLVADNFKKTFMEVVNHTSCKTECVMTKNECSSPARFDPKSCKCVCHVGVVGPFGKQCSDPRKVWDDASCGCICRNTKKCPNRRKYFDQETCSCLCKKRALSGGCSYNDGDFDKLTCSCYRKSRTMDHSKEATKVKGHTIYWLSAVAVEFFLMVCAFEAFLYSKNSGLIFSTKARLLPAAKFEDKKKEQPKGGMRYREVLSRQSRLSSTLRSRASRTSNVHPAPQTPGAVVSPSYSAEDVFFNE